MTGVPGPGPGAAEAFGKFQLCEVQAREDEENGTKQHSIYGLRAFTCASFPSKTAHLLSSALQRRRALEFLRLNRVAHGVRMDGNGVFRFIPSIC